MPDLPGFDHYLQSLADAAAGTDPEHECSFCGDGVYLAEDEIGLDSEHVPGLFCSDRCKARAEIEYLGRMCKTVSQFRDDQKELCPIFEAPVIVNVDGARLLVTGLHDEKGALVLHTREMTDGEAALIESAPWE